MTMYVRTLTLGKTLISQNWIRLIRYEIDNLDPFIIRKEEKSFIILILLIVWVFYFIWSL